MFFFVLCLLWCRLSLWKRWPCQGDYYIIQYMGHWPGQGTTLWGKKEEDGKKNQKGTEPFSMRKLMSTKMLQKHLKLFTTGESSWENPVKKKTTEATTTTAAVAARIYAISPRAQLGHSCHIFHASPCRPPSQHPQCRRPCALPLASSAMHFNA